MTIRIFDPRAIYPPGEDSMYVVLRIEEEFSISLAETELATIATVGELYSVILSKLEIGDSWRASHAFYRLRKAMMARLGLPRKSIRPATKLAVLLPESKRKMLWKQLEDLSGLTFPKLRHPRWARDVIRSVALLAAIVFQLLMVRWRHPHGAWWVPLELGVFAVFVIARQSLYAATKFKGIGLPMRTVGELAEALPQANLTQFRPAGGDALPYGRKEVWEQLVEVLCDVLKVDAGKISVETRFEDLKLD